MSQPSKTKVIKLQPKKDKKDEKSKKFNKVEQLLFKLEDCGEDYLFWKDDTKIANILGIKQITRTHIEKLNENGFNPYDKYITEKLFKFFAIDVVESTDKYKFTKEDLKKLERAGNMGWIYLKTGDINFIYKTIVNVK